MQVLPSALILNQKAPEKRRLLIKGLSFSRGAYPYSRSPPYVHKTYKGILATSAYGGIE